ncbi:hypothetical protein CNR22_09115 [Sphingobacteriaceae bacterium]|nr:hypothetical protein CNR22_09115 [Sphingobacteriaceae bacterium]
MKSKLLLAITAGFLFCSTQQKAQVSNYSFTQTLSTYGSANTGSLVGLAIQDDDVATVSLPFSFTYDGTAYSSINVCSNGYFSFNTLTGDEYFAIQTSTTSNVISPFGNDLYKGMFINVDMTAGSATLTNVSSTAGLAVGTIFEDFFGDFSSNPTIVSITGNTIVLNQPALFTNTAYPMVSTHGTIKQSVSGISPNRICEFEFANFSRYFEPDEILNFKLRLYETSNKIEALYGPMTVAPDYIPSEVGLKGASNTDYNSRLVNASVNTWSNSSASTSITDFCDFDNTIFPASGQSYMWTPVSCTVPVLAVSATNSVACAGVSVVLTATGATTYSWSNGPATAQQTVTPSATTVYTLTGANTTCTSSITYTQVVAATPTLTIASSSSVSCAGQSATLTANGATSYSWNAIASASQNIVSPTVTTTYSLTGSNGTCTANTSFTQTVVAYPVLTVAITPTVICVGNSATVTVSGATTYSFNNVAGTSSTVITPSATATYTIAGANGACATTKTLTQTVLTDCATGIKEASLESVGISAYPNPFGSALNIKNASENELNVSISDALGKVIYSAKLKGQSVETISGESLNSGLYFISVQGTNGSITKKLIKQ